MSPPSSSEPDNPYMRQVNTDSRWRRFTRALYNPDEKTFVGRTVKGWGMLLTFYAVFYAVLAALFSICMFVMLKSMPKERPYYRLEESLIGTNPGLGFRPQFVDEASLIHFDHKNETQVSKYVQDIELMLKPYKELSYPGASSRVACSFTLTAPHLATQACLVNINAYGPCSAANAYGYRTGQPCIFIKLNRIFDWEPEYITSSADMPDMPDDVKKHIDSLPVEQRKQVWISCAGEGPADREALSGGAASAAAAGADIAYYPTPGIPRYYYPYRNQRGYVSPLVAVQFTRLERNRIVNIRCRAWAGNIEYNHSLKDIRGSTHIEIMVD